MGITVKGLVPGVSIGREGVILPSISWANFEKCSHIYIGAGRERETDRSSRENTINNSEHMSHSVPNHTSVLQWVVVDFMISKENYESRSGSMSRQVDVHDVT
jgi:hypothetical protein